MTLRLTRILAQAIAAAGFIASAITACAMVTP